MMKQLLAKLDRRERIRLSLNDVALFTDARWVPTDETLDWVPNHGQLWPSDQYGSFAATRARIKTSHQKRGERWQSTTCPTESCRCRVIVVDNIDNQLCVYMCNFYCILEPKMGTWRLTAAAWPVVGECVIYLRCGSMNGQMAPAVRAGSWFIGEKCGFTLSPWKKMPQAWWLPSWQVENFASLQVFSSNNVTYTKTFILRSMIKIWIETIMTFITFILN